MLDIEDFIVDDLYIKLALLGADPLSREKLV
jgi:hypothetical protein